MVQVRRYEGELPINRFDVLLGIRKEEDVCKLWPEVGNYAEVAILTAMDAMQQSTP
jgi:hypothetical protein